MAQKNSSFSTNIGGAFILVIFVLLCLTTFATLSLVSANADYKLTVKSAESTLQYYAADSKAEELLCEIDTMLHNSRQSAAEEEHYRALCREQLTALPAVELSEEDETLLLSYQVEISERQALSVQLRVLPLAHARRYERLRWQTVQTAEWIPDESLGIWSGK